MVKKEDKRKHHIPIEDENNDKEESKKTEAPGEDSRESCEVKDTITNEEEDEKKSVEEMEENYLDHIKRLQAEFKNYKKRMEKDWARAKILAKADVIKKLLPVSDDFERLLAHHKDEEMVETGGVRLIFQKMIKVFEEEGLEPIAAEGEPFDPEFHCALATEDVDDIEKDDIILEEWQKGYFLGDKLLRPSQVKVARYTGDEQE